MREPYKSAAESLIDYYCAVTPDNVNKLTPEQRRDYFKRKKLREKETQCRVQVTENNV